VVETDYIDVMLALGGHQEVLAGLRRTTTIDPLAEGPAAQLMLALYRAGRKTEALEAFSRARGAMIQAFGTDLSPRLDALHIQILGDSPTSRARSGRALSPVQWWGRRSLSCVMRRG
jgi:DNA-binding SARP family transcriptional activator